MRTETLYRKTDLWCTKEDALKYGNHWQECKLVHDKIDGELNKNKYSFFEPVTVHVGEFYLKRNDIVGGEYYEKVTHVLPNHIVDANKKVEITDDYEYVLLKEGDEIREGDEYFGSIDGGWFKSQKEFDVAKSIPYRRRVSKSEIQKKVEELKTQVDEECNSNYLKACELLVLHKEIQSKSEQLIKAWAEIDRLKALGNQPHHVDALCHAIEGYKKEIESLKSQVVNWRKLNGVNKDFVAQTFNEDDETKVVEVVFQNYACLIPLPPIETTLDQESEAFNEIMTLSDKTRKFLYENGFKARAEMEGK